MLVIDGQVVPDDDPRAVEFRRRTQPSSSRQQQGNRQNAAGGGATQGVPPRRTPPGPFGASTEHSTRARAANNNAGALPPWLQPNMPLGRINRQLTGYWQPFNIGSFVVQPIMVVIIIASYLVLGLPGVLLAMASLYWSRQ